MNDIEELLDVVKNTARSACEALCAEADELRQGYRYSAEVPREMKAEVDRTLDEKILETLTPLGLPILSEETEPRRDAVEAGLRFVVDPLDGTVNYIRGLGPASVSIAVCEGEAPVCGAIGVYPSGELAWGGKGIGAYLNGRSIKVSNVAAEEQAVLCTGFPARFRLAHNRETERFCRTINRYGKVRMLGSASISLLHVAKGAAELYFENEIMLWDVAAGLAIVEGAQGEVGIESGRVGGALTVTASNGMISLP